MLLFHQVRCDERQFPARGPSFDDDHEHDVSSFDVTRSMNAVQGIIGLLDYIYLQGLQAVNSHTCSLCTTQSQTAQPHQLNPYANASPLHIKAFPQTLHEPGIPTKCHTKAGVPCCLQVINGAH